MTSASESWICPLCERKFKIPAGTRLTACPDCQKKPTLRRSSNESSKPEEWYIPGTERLSGPFNVGRILEMYEHGELLMDDIVQKGLDGKPQMVVVIAEQYGKQAKPSVRTERVQTIPIVTTETIQIPNMEFVRHLPVIFSRRVYGFNVFAEMLVGMRDMAGGRSKRMEDCIEDIEREIIDDLRRKARSAGATAIVGLNIQLGNLSGDKSLLIYGVAQGTPVFMRKVQKAIEDQDEFEFTDSTFDDE